MPSVRTITKSRSSPGPHRTSPFTRSCRICSSSGMRNRTTGYAALRLERGDLLLGQRTAPPVVAGRLPTCPRRAAPLLELLGGAVAAIGVLPLQEAGHRLGIDLGPLGLPVGSVRSADLRALVPVEAEPAHVLEHAAERLLGHARRVGVLDPQDERAAVVPGPEPREQGASCVPHVQRPRRRGREATANAHGPTTGFRSVPMPSTSTSTTSPGDDLADTLRGPGQEHVAGQQRHERGDELDEGGDPEDHVLGAAVLHDLPVQARLDDDAGGIDVGGDPRTQRTRTVEALGPGPLIVGLLQGTQGDIVGAGETEDEAGGVLRPNVACQPPHHHGELALVVDPTADGQQPDGIARTDHRRRGFEEQQRFLRDLRIELGRVCGVVLSDAHDLRRQDRSEQQDIVQLDGLTGRQRVLEEGAGEHLDRVGARLDRAGGDPVTVSESDESHAGAGYRTPELP